MDIVKIIRDFLYRGLEHYGRFYSVYRGYVFNREDKDDFNRLQLIIPQVMGVDKPYKYWAWPKNNFSGKNYGSQIIPQKGDMVWVEFEFGDPQKPIWSFGHFGKGEKPSKLKGNYDNYWFQTPKGQLVEIDDKNALIRLTDKTGNIIETNKNGISLVLKGKYINLGKLDEAKEPVLKGDKSETLFKDYVKSLEDCYKQMDDIITQVISVNSSIPTMAPNPGALVQLPILKATIAANKAKLQEFSLKIEETKSLKVKTE